MCDEESGPDDRALPPGIAGLDDILGGGLPADSFYLISREPGSGKTTPAMQFLLDGVRAGSLATHVHELLAYLGPIGVVTILSVTRDGMLSGGSNPSVDITHLADNVILCRYLEARGHVRRAVSVMKKRDGRHESRIREFHVAHKGLELGHPLENFQGVLGVIPAYLDDGAALSKKDADER